MGFGGSKQRSSSKSEQNPWAPATGYLKDVMSQANQLYQNEGGINANNFINREATALTPEMQNAVTSLTENTANQGLSNQIAQGAQTGSAGLGTAVGSLTNLANKNTTSEDIANAAQGLYQSDLVNNQISQAKQAATEQLNSDLQTINQGATQSGNMGSSRAGVATGVAEREVNKDLQNTVSNIQDQARQQAFSMAQNQLNANTQNQANAAGTLAQTGLSALNQYTNAANINQQNQQNQLTAAGITQQQAQDVNDVNYYNQYGQANQGWENLGNLAGIVTTIGGMGGTGTGTATQKTGGSALGTVATIGGGLMKGFGFSDAKLKENVKKVGKDVQGNTRYEWDWNKEGNKLGLKGKGRGVLAQQVAHDKPDAVATDSNSGKLMVDYGALGGKGGVVAKTKTKKKGGK